MNVPILSAVKSQAFYLPLVITNVQPGMSLTPTSMGHTGPGQIDITGDVNTTSLLSAAYLADAGSGSHFYRVNFPASFTIISPVGTSVMFSVLVYIAVPINNGISTTNARYGYSFY